MSRVFPFCSDSARFSAPRQAQTTPGTAGAVLIVEDLSEGIFRRHQRHVRVEPDLRFELACAPWQRVGLSL